MGSNDLLDMIEGGRSQSGNAARRIISEYKDSNGMTMTVRTSNNVGGIGSRAAPSAEGASSTGLR